MTRIIPRAEWGALAPTRGVAIHLADRSRRYGFVGHHGASASPRDPQDAANILRSYQRLHMNNGWGDIGYNFAVDRFGNVYEARGLDKVGAHVAGANTPNIGVVLIGDGLRDLTEEAKEAFRWLYAHVNSQIGRTLTPSWHSRFLSTACPRPPVIEFFRNGLSSAPSTPSQPAPQPPIVVDEPDSVLRVDGVRGPATTRRKQSWLGVVPDGVFGKRSTTAEQALLKRLGYNLGPWGVDGDRGAFTRRAWQSFLKREGYYSGAIDGIELGQTIRAEQNFLNDQLKKGTKSNTAVLKRAAVATPPVNRPIIRRGSKNAHVGYAQTRLRAHGFILSVDNDFGPETERITELFQKKMGLVPDKIIGPKTWARLG